MNQEFARCGRTAMLLCSLTLPMMAQSLSVGLKAGWPVTYSADYSFQSSQFAYDSSSHSYIVGGMVELRLPLGLAVEADVLYHPFNLRYANIADGTTRTTDHGLFEFPILAKYRFSRHVITPYVEGGPSFRTQPGALARIGGGDFSSSGITVGAGVEFKLLVLRIAPEFRYTHWGSDQFYPASVNQSGDNHDQAALLVGVSF